MSIHLHQGSEGKAELGVTTLPALGSSAGVQVIPTGFKHDEVWGWSPINRSTLKGF